MKRSFKMPTLLAAFSSALLLTACGGNVLDFRNAENSNGKIYKAGDNEPFTGKVTNIPDDKVLIAQDGFKKVSTILVNMVFSKGQPDPSGPSSMSFFTILANANSLCDMKFRDGYPDGEATCKRQNSETHTFDMAFKNGALDGDFRYYGPKGGEHVVSAVSFRNGQPDGKQEVFNEATQKVVYSVYWKNGVLDGSEEAYDADTGAVIGRATYVDGKVDGEIVHYAKDGKQVTYKATATAGQKNGPEDMYSDTGKHLFHGQWVNGKQQGLIQQWDEQGNLVAQKTWDNGVDVALAAATPRPAVTVTNTEECVSAWVTAFHKENGDDAIVTFDQQGEWQNWCRQGKHPS